MMANVIEKVLRDTGEFAESEIVESAKFVESFSSLVVKTMESTIFAKPVSELLGLKKENE